MSNCSGCNWEFFPEHDDIFKFNDKSYCETCWTENVCHICGYYDKHSDYYYCEKCMKHISTDCGCGVIYECQYHGVTCRKCIEANKYFCSKCKVDLYPFIISSTVNYCEGETTYNKKCYYGMFCQSCLIDRINSDKN